MDENGPTTIEELFALYGCELEFRDWMEKKGYHTLSYSNQMRLAEAWIAGYDLGTEDAR